MHRFPFRNDGDGASHSVPCAAMSVTFPAWPGEESSGELMATPPVKSSADPCRTGGGNHRRQSSTSCPSTGFSGSRFGGTADPSASASPALIGDAPAVRGGALPPVAFPSWAALTDALTAVDAHLRAHAPGSPAHPTCFHSSVAPAVTLADFAYFLCARTQYDTAGLAIGLALMVRHVHGDTGAPLGIADSSLELDGADLMVAADEPTPPRPLCAMTAHRLLLACVAVGAKANFDNFIRNVFVAELVGVELSELNWLEATLLQDLAYRAMPTGAEVADAPRALVAAVTAATAST